MLFFFGYRTGLENLFGCLENMELMGTDLLWVLILNHWLCLRRFDIDYIDEKSFVKCENIICKEWNSMDYIAMTS